MSSPFDPVSRESVAEMLNDFGEIYRREITPKLAQIYWDQLKHFRQHQFDSAVRYVHAHERFFPPPAAFLAAERRQWT